MTQLDKIYRYENADNYPAGTKLDDIPQFGACRNGSVVDALGVTGSKAIRTWIEKGRDGWAEWGYALEMPKLRAGDHIWWRQAFKFPGESNLSTDHGSLKTFRIGRLSDAGENRGYVDVQIKSNLDWRSIVEFTDQGWHHYEGGRVVKSVWQFFEIHVYLHPGQGFIKISRNGKVFGMTSGIETIKANSYVNRLLLGTYWNGSAPKTQEHYYDEIAVAIKSQDRDDRPYLGKDDRGELAIGMATADQPLPPPVDPPVEPPPIDPELPVEPPEPPPEFEIEGGITLTHDKTMCHVGDNEIIITSDKPVNVL